MEIPYKRRLFKQLDVIDRSVAVKCTDTLPHKLFVVIVQLIIVIVIQKHCCGIKCPIDAESSY